MFDLIEEGLIAKRPKTLRNFVQNLAILLRDTTGLYFISKRVVEDILLMVFRIFPVTLVAIDMAILKNLEQIWKVRVLLAKILPIERQNRNTAERFP